MIRPALFLLALALPGCLDYETIEQLFQDPAPEGTVVQITIPPRPMGHHPAGDVSVKPAGGSRGR